MTFGNLEFLPVLEHKELVSLPVAAALENLPGIAEVGVSEIDPTLSDTAAFCSEYAVGPEQAANCVILKAKRDGEYFYAACVVLATTRADVNGLACAALGAKKASFAPMEEAVSLSGMEFGAITPVGLPAGWPILVDKAVANSSRVIIGSGIRSSKLLVPGSFFATLPNVQILDGLGQPRP